jgi:hypothetical protein
MDRTNRIIKIHRRLEEVAEQLACNEMCQYERLIEEQTALEEELESLDGFSEEAYSMFLGKYNK